LRAANNVNTAGARFSAVSATLLSCGRGDEDAAPYLCLGGQVSRELPGTDLILNPQWLLHISLVSAAMSSGSLPVRPQPFPRGKHRT